MSQKEKTQIPQSKGWPVLGHLLSYQKDKLGLLESLRRDLGPSFRFRLGPKMLTVLTRPEDVERVMLSNMNNYIKKTNFDQIFREGLFTANGEHWKKQRVSMQSLFTPAYLDACVPAVTETCRQELGGLIDAQPNDEMDAYDVFARLSFSLIVDLIVGYDFKALFRPLNESFNYCANYLTYESYNPLPFAGFFSPYKKPEFHKKLAFMDEQVMRSIDEQSDPALRKKHSIVSKMLAAHESGKLPDISRELMRDNVIGLMFAGYETTALTLSWLFYLLAKHPDVQEKLRAELMEIEFANAADLRKAKYCDQVLDEALRLYPAGWAFTRVAVGHDRLSDCEVGPGEIIFISAYLNHRDSEHWEQPERFWPERFDQDSIAKSPHKFSFFPFGGGARLCIGKGLAILEMKIIIQQLLKGYRVEPGSQDPTPAPMATLNSANGFPLRFKKCH